MTERCENRTTSDGHDIPTDGVFSVTRPDLTAVYDNDPQEDQ